MRSIRFKLSVLRPIRFLVAVCVSALLLLSHAFPAYSAPVNPTGNKTAPQEGEEQLLGVEREAQEAVLKDPYSREETQYKANKGLNEVQGDANAGQFYSPDNSGGASSGASSVEDKVKNALEKVTGRD